MKSDYQEPVAPVKSESPKKRGRGRPKKVPDADKVPKGSHKMPDGTTMKDKDMPKKKAPDKEKKEKKVPAKKGGGDWKGHLAKTYAAEKKKNPKYKYSEAMKAAAKTYKK